MNNIAIFDLDGTLLNSIGDLVLAANNTREKFGLPPLPQETIKSFVGDGVVKFVERLFNSQQIEEELKTFKEEYILHIADTTKPYEGIMEVILNIKSRNFVVGILSNKSSNLTNLVLEMLNIYFFFDFVYGGDNFPEKKPSPIPILKILEEFDGNRGTSFMIGDSCNDILAGKNAGVKTIGVTYGFSPRNYINECKPDFVANTPLEIEKYIISD